jgi:acyl-CoA thioesterase I
MDTRAPSRPSSIARGGSSTLDCGPHVVRFPLNIMIGELLSCLGPGALRVVAVAGVVGFAACGSSGQSPSAPSTTGAAEPPRLDVVAFGDSLTAGPGLEPHETYPAVLQRTLDAAGYNYRVVNAGVSGDTTTGGLQRFERSLTASTRVVILALGANDGFRGVPVATVRRNLEAMIVVAKARGIDVLLCGMEAPPVHGWQYSLNFHFIFPELAAEHDLTLVPFMLTGVLGRAELNLYDGIHPNAEGARVVAENIWPYLEPVLKRAVLTP